ncbi:CrV1 protein [Cotesia vestalis bracovirus]|nr:CrV1 protein [Cotesia vestalis bracovirus]
MSLVKSAFVLLSALLSQSCTQALPSQYQWEGIPDNPIADVTPLSPLTDRSSPKSDFSAGTNNFDESDVHNRESSMIPKYFSEEPGKYPNFGHFSKSQHHYRPRYLKRHKSIVKTRPSGRHISKFINARSSMGLPGSIIASGVFSGPGNFVGDLHFAQPQVFDGPRTQQPGYESETYGKRYITREDLLSELHAIEKALKKLTSAVIQIEDGFDSNSFTTSPQPPVLIDPIVIEGVTYPTVTTSPQPPVLIDPSVASDLEPKEPSVEGVTYPTVTTSPQPPVLNNPSGVSELGPIEATNEEGVTYSTVTTSPQPPVLIDPIVAPDLEPKKPSVKEVTNPTLTTTPQPPVLNNSNGVSELGPIEANNEEEATYPTVTNSSQPTVPIDPSVASELGPIEANNKEEATYPTVTNSAQPTVPVDSSVASELGPIEANNEEEEDNYSSITNSAQPSVPIESSVASERGPIEANNGEEATYPTITSSMERPVLIDPREEYELQMLESLYETMHGNIARKEEPEQNYLPANELH